MIIQKYYMRLFFVIIYFIFFLGSLSVPSIFAVMATSIKIGYPHLLYWRSQNVPILLLDLRQPYEYARGYIPGAYNVPFQMLEHFYGKTYQNTILVLYADTEEQALQAARYFNQETYILSGGFLGWLRLGYIVHKQTDTENKLVEEQETYEVLPTSFYEDDVKLSSSKVNLKNERLYFSNRNYSFPESKRYKDRTYYRIRSQQKKTNR